MSIFLVGGGPDTTSSGLLEPFRAEAELHAGARRPRVAVVLFDHQGSSGRYLPEYVQALGDGVDAEPVLVQRGRSVGPEAFADVDGIAVGGGPTPEYLAGLSDAGPAIRAAATSGVPYLGFSAGAMIAPATALIGGYQSAGYDVCPKEWSEGLDSITVRPGLGLVSFAVDVHTAQAGTLGRTVALIESGEVTSAAGIDEDTCLTLTTSNPTLDKYAVTGTGTVWLVTPSPITITRAKA